MPDSATLNENDAEILPISQLEELDIKDFQTHIKYSLIPSLDKDYQFIKAYIKGTSKKLVYNIRKSLIDLLDGEEEIKLIRYDSNDTIISLYEASYSMIQCLNSIYFFITIMRSKTPCIADNTTIENIFKKLLKDIRTLQVEIMDQIETHRQY